MSWPTSIATNADLHIAVNNTATILTADITTGSPSIPVVDASPFPSTGFITIDAEIIKYTSKTGTTFDGLTRGADGSSAAVHTNTTPVHHYAIAAHHNDLKDELIALETDLFSGISGDLDDSVSPTATASNIKTRLDHFATQLKSILGTSDWKDSPTDTLDNLDSRLDTAETDVTNLETDTSNLKKNIRNILTNGGFDVWQRGTSFSVVPTGTWTADRWYFVKSNSSVHNFTREATEVKTGNYSMKHVISSQSGGAYIRLTNEIERPEDYYGKTLTVSAWVKANNPYYLLVYSNVVYTHATHTGDNTWQKLTLTINPTSGPLRIILGGDSVNGSTPDPVNVTAYIDSVMLVEGTEAMDYIPEDPATELERCQRYYEVRNTVYNTGLPLTTASGHQVYHPEQFKVTKAATPTITLTLTQASFYSSPGQGYIAPVADVANWTLTAGQVATEGFYSSFNRGLLLLTHNVLSTAHNWEAEA